MTGQRRPIPSKFAIIVIFGAFAVSINGPAHADKRNGAPIKYLGQGSVQTSSPIGHDLRSGLATKGMAPAKAAHASAPQSHQPENARTKRIEFRYPDQPGVVHGSDGTTRQGQGNPFKYSSQQSAMNVQAAKKVAAVSQPVPAALPKTKAPILHQPAYQRPVIEEKVLDDFVPAVALPSTKSAVLEPVAQPRFDATGTASWYGEAYHGQPTANGEIFDMNGLSAAHPTLPLPSLVQVTNLENGKEIVVRVNDRGPFVPDRMIDMSKRAAAELGFIAAGEAQVSVRYLGPAPVANKLAGQGGTLNEPALRKPEPPTSTPLNPAVSQPKMDPIPNPASDVFFIQAGSFSEISNAQRLSSELGGSLPVDVALANVNGADFFRVLIGPYNSRTEAAAMRDQLDVSGIVSGILVSANN